MPSSTEPNHMSAAGGVIKLRTGALMPSIGFGTWNLKGDEAIQSIEFALDAGYRSIDTAAAYRNEEEVGKAIANQIATGKIRRQDIFVTTKFYPTTVKNRKDVELRLNESLAKLNLSYVDLYLQHKPEMEGSASNDEMWKGLEDVYRLGMTKAIGVSTFDTSQLDHLWNNAEIKPHNVQNEANLYVLDTSALDYCKRQGISVTSWSPLRNPVWQGNYGKANPMDSSLVKRIAARHSKSLGQVLLRHLLQQGIAVIPKSSKKERILENFSILDFNLSKEEMAELNAQNESLVPKINAKH